MMGGCLNHHLLLSKTNAESLALGLELISRLSNRRRSFAGHHDLEISGEDGNRGDRS